jgi:Skp family chaperone for outer membrane proteins
METEDDYRGRIIKVVEQVAGEKKLVLVVGKQAIAWNSATIEITDEVLSRLNKS